MNIIFWTPIFILCNKKQKKSKKPTEIEKKIQNVVYFSFSYMYYVTNPDIVARYSDIPLPGECKNSNLNMIYVYLFVILILSGSPDRLLPRFGFHL